MQKLTEEELGNLRDIVGKYNDIKIKIADTCIAKQSYLLEIDNMKSEYVKEEQKLLVKYGETATINIQTGEVSGGGN